MPKHWRLAAFEDLLAEPVRNGVYKSKEYHGRGIRMVNMGELFGNDFISAQEMERIELTPAEQAKSCLENGDLLFARRSLVLEGSGKCALVRNLTEKTTFESSIIRARPNQALVEPRFLFYLFKSPLGRAIVASIATRTAVSGIRGSDLMQISLPVPPLHVQRRLSEVVAFYDDLIENNTRRIKILERMAQALYREWFVHFRFPGHAKVKRVASPLGPVPQGWKLVAVPEAVHVNPKTAVPKDGMKPFVPMTSLSNGSMLISDIESREGNSGSKFKNGDTLFARITPCLENGKTAFVQFLPSEDDVAFGSTEFIVLRARTVTPEYVYCIARSDEFRANAIKSMSGATGRQRVQEACFEKFLIAQPGERELTAFTEVARPMFKLIHCLATKNANLRRTRDLLLPKLISGALDVSKPELETA